MEDHEAIIDGRNASVDKGWLQNATAIAHTAGLRFAADAQVDHCPQVTAFHCLFTIFALSLHCPSTVLSPPFTAVLLPAQVGWAFAGNKADPTRPVHQQVISTASATTADFCPSPPYPTRPPRGSPLCTDHHRACPRAVPSLAAVSTAKERSARQQHHMRCVPCIWFKIPHALNATHICKADDNAASRAA